MPSELVVTIIPRRSLSTDIKTFGCKSSPWPSFTPSAFVTSAGFASALDDTTADVPDKAASAAARLMRLIGFVDITLGSP